MLVWSDPMCGNVGLEACESLLCQFSHHTGQCISWEVWRQQSEGTAPTPGTCQLRVEAEPRSYLTYLVQQGMTHTHCLQKMVVHINQLLGNTK